MKKDVELMMNQLQSQDSIETYYMSVTHKEVVTRKGDADRLQVVPLDEDEENQCIRLLSFCKRHSPNRSIERVAPDERMGQLPSQQ
uniref:Histone-lysine N-methyltransferase ATX2-like isoform X1 n=1 Tax=Tanacetum cinerariifolium TaxID=118510 RepID=A0A6L2M440_TANCI|nr:histone-lysine N-methyltransferase ATX2-like isoform X1 [Tanacetum cinerariifolium]